MVVIMVFTITACETAEEKQNKVIDQKPLVVVVTDEGGIGDYSFNDSVLSALEDAKKEYKIDIRCIEAETEKSYEEHIQDAVYEDASIVIAAGSHMGKAIKKVAKENPDKYFGVVDSKVVGDNIFSISFADNESGFLAGYAAGKTSKTGHVGMIAGEKRETVNLYRYGFEAGLKMANPNAKFTMKYVGTFLDSEKGYQVANEMIENNDVDVIFHVAGATGKGIIKACKEKDIWVIGADKDQSSLASNNVLCSATKDMEEGIAEMVEMAIGEEKFEGGNKTFTINDDGVELSDNAGNLDAKVKDEIEEMKERIDDKELKIPFNAETLKTFLDNINGKK